MKALKKVISPYIKKNFWKVLGLICIAIIISLLSMTIPYFNGKAVDIIISFSKVNELYISVTILAGVYLAKYILSLFMQNAFLKLSVRIVSDMRAAMIKKALDLSIMYYDQHDIGYIISRTAECNSITMLFSPSLISLFLSMIEFVGAIIISYNISKKLFLLVIIFIPIQIILVLISSRKLSAETKRMFEASANTSGEIFQLVSGVSDIKILNLYEKVMNKIKKVIDKYFTIYIRQGKVSIYYNENTQLVSTVVHLLLLLTSGVMIINGEITLGIYTAFGGYATKIVGSIQSFSNIAILMSPIQASASRILEFMDLPEENKGKKGILKKQYIASIKLNNVDFSYGENKIIKSLDYDIIAEQKILLTGKNGVGKTTLTKLLLGFYDNYEGEIKINGKDLYKINRDYIRDRIAVVSQRCYLFSESVIDNIICEGDISSKKYFFVLLKKYELYSYFDGLRQGVNTLIKADATNISAGQRQLIAFFRAICSKKRFLILDEPTANMETGLKEKVAKLLIGEGERRTYLIVSHDEVFNSYLKKNGFIEWKL